MTKKLTANAEETTPRVVISTPYFRPIEYTRFEYPTGKSMTVPNQVLTPAEMLDRFTRGLPLDTSVSKPFYSDEELPDLARMDLSERFDIMAETEETIRQAKAEQEHKRKKQVEDDLKKAAREELLKEQQEQLKSPTTPPTTAP